MKKRILALIFVALVLLLIFGCSDDGANVVTDMTGESEEILTITEEPQIPDYITINGESYSIGETELKLTSLPITDADIEKIGHMSELRSLTIIGANEISDIGPLANLTNLTYLNISQTTIGDMSSLAALANLETLYLSYNPIGDISPLSGLVNLTTLTLWDSQVIDIGPLAGLTNLSELNLGNNQIGDISPLANLTNLTSLSFVYNPVGDVGPLANLTNLTWLSLSMIYLDDVSPLANLTNLERLDLDWIFDPITDKTRKHMAELWAALPNTTILDAIQILPDDTKRGTERKMQASANEIDEKALGKWETIDFVENIDDFVPGQESNLKNLLAENFVLASCAFFENGTVLREFITYWKFFSEWKSGYIIIDPSKPTPFVSEDDVNIELRAYEIKTINGQEYMFVERDLLYIVWENGDLTHSDRPWHYVLKKTMSHDEMLSHYDSIERDYDWYFDQLETGEYRNFNCGPTSAVMAAKWYDRDFSKTPEEARNRFDIANGINETGEITGWTMGMMMDFLTSVNVNAKMVDCGLNLENALNHLDMGNILVIGLEMKYIKIGDTREWMDDEISGHALIVKGYKSFRGETYFEVYDPGGGPTYYDGSPWGKDKLYLASEVIEGTINRSVYIIVEAPPY